MLMSLLIVLWLQCQLPSSAALPAPEPASAATVQVNATAQAESIQLTAPKARASFQSEFVQSLLSCLPTMEQPVNRPDANFNEFSRYPARITASSQPDAVTYKQRPGYYALRFADPEAEPDDAITVIRYEKGAIALFKGAPSISLQRSEEKPLPVYGTGDTAAVPTGEVFIRFRESVDARDRYADIEAAGYTITKVLDFAPQGAWVHAISGETADSLQRLTQLEDLVDLENVEPQFLMERQLR